MPSVLLDHPGFFHHPTTLITLFRLSRTLRRYFHAMRSTSSHCKGPNAEYCEPGISLTSWGPVGHMFSGSRRHLKGPGPPTSNSHSLSTVSTSRCPRSLTNARRNTNRKPSFPLLGLHFPAAPSRCCFRHWPFISGTLFRPTRNSGRLSTFECCNTAKASPAAAMPKPQFDGRDESRVYASRRIISSRLALSRLFPVALLVVHCSRSYDVLGCPLQLIWRVMIRTRSCY